MKRFDLKALAIGFIGLFFSSIALGLSSLALLVAIGLKDWFNDYEYPILITLSVLSLIIGGYYAQRHTREGIIWNQALIMGLIMFTWSFSESIILIGDPESDPFFVNFLIDLSMLAAPYVGGKVANKEKKWYRERG
ncbi:hypothetical protein K0T92_04080 [Paenibacillus oenotherae]|uniref:Uncharacterized protein n=1 Tax=Paenibacillus oenotherae TaxID=1435645 RepID=A0ABS7D1Z6_9BACL|nr:hypothetical protein [Paenibacillus oenotherae]MBW7473910.1 hypothetical protein [Paenibacillus oenotherae]